MTFRHIGLNNPHKELISYFYEFFDAKIKVEKQILYNWYNKFIFF